VLNIMSDQDIQRLIELAKQKLQEKTTPEEALRSLQLAGIFDENGNYTAPYKDLEDLTGQ
jgi:hypothetical protein